MFPPQFAYFSQNKPQEVCMTNFSALTGAPVATYKNFGSAARECIRQKLSYHLSPTDGSLFESILAYLFPSLLFRMIEEL